MPGGSGGSMPESGPESVHKKVRKNDLFYRKTKKGGEAESSSNPMDVGGGARGGGARGVADGPATRRHARAAVHSSPIPPVESNEEEEEEQHEEEEELDQQDEAMAAHDSDSGSEVSLKDDEVPEEAEFVESDEDIQKLNLPVKKKVFLRGPARLPDLPYAASHFQLAPRGKMCFKHVTGKPPRTYSGILGALVRKHFPGRVKTHNGTREVAWTFKHYFLKRDVMDLRGRKYTTIGHRVVEEFWQYFTPADGTREAGTQVVIQMAQKHVHDMHYEARVGCVINWYAEHRKVSLPKHNARGKHLKAWQYLQVPPRWCLYKKRCFRKMVRWWTSDEYKKDHEEASGRRGEMLGPAHRQGNLSLYGVQEKKEREAGEPVSLFRCFVETRTMDEPHPDHPELGLWTNEGAMLRNDGYTTSFKAKYGSEADPLNLPFDPEVAVLAGGGLQNGRLWIGDGCIPLATIPSLTTARATNSSSSIRTRPKPSMARYSEIQARLDEQMRRREEAELRETQMREAMAAQHQQMIEQQAFMAALSQQVQALSSASGGTSLPPLPPLPALSFGMTVHPSAGSNNVEQAGPHESLVTPTTASQPQPPLNTSNTRRQL